MIKPQKGSRVSLGAKVPKEKTKFCGDEKTTEAPKFIMDPGVKIRPGRELISRFVIRVIYVKQKGR